MTDRADHVQVPDMLRKAMEAHGVDVDSVRETIAAGDPIPPDELAAEQQQIRQAGGARCCDCGKPANPNDPNVLHQIVGWTKPREKGGTNHVIRRATTGFIMCADCSLRLVHVGPTAGQETLPV